MSEVASFGRDPPAELRLEEGTLSSLPVEWLDAVAVAASERGRNLVLAEITTTELAQLWTSYRLGRSPEEATTLLCGGLVRPLTGGELATLDAVEESFA